MSFATQIKSHAGLFLVLLFCCTRQDRVRAAELCIGVPSFTSSVNLLTSDQPVAFVARHFSAEGLVKISQNSITLNIASEITSSQLYRDSQFVNIWKVKLGQGARFANHRPVHLSDVLFSLQLCLADGRLAGFSKIEVGSVSNGMWPDSILLEQHAGSSAGVFVELASCAIVEEASSRLFGGHLGQSGSAVTKGDYVIREALFSGDIPAVRELRLGRLGSSFSSALPNKVVIRAVDSGPAGLTALRTGALSGFYTDDQAMWEAIVGDETLSIKQCGKWMLVARVSEKLNCV